MMEHFPACVRPLNSVKSKVSFVEFEDGRQEPPILDFNARPHNAILWERRAQSNDLKFEKTIESHKIWILNLALQEIVSIKIHKASGILVPN